MIVSKPRLFVEVGQRFGRGVVIDTEVRIPQPVASDLNRVLRAARLVCDCGNEYIARIDAILSGNTRSCSCLLDERRRQPWKSRPPGVVARGIILKGYRRDARRRNLSWELTEEQFDELTSSDCFYCGGPPSTVKKPVATYEGGEFIYNGIDRVDNSFGYMSENVVTCCKICNRAKSDMPFEDFMTWATRLAAYRSEIRVMA